MVRKINIALWLTLLVAFYGCAANQASVGTGAVQTLFAAYRGPLNSLAGVRAGPCPMLPSCSEYMRQAIAKHGVAKGWIMGTERLMRCGHEAPHPDRTVWVNGHYKIYDPPEYNDFWWSKPSQPRRDAPSFK